MAAVTLHIYDVRGHNLAKSLNKVLRAVGTGAFHAAVEVNGKEWSYGFEEEGTGVFSCPPKGCEAHSYRESLPMGQTSMSGRSVQALLDEMSEEWLGEEYDFLQHNCCHFSDAFCRRLGVGPIPSWVTNLASAGATLHKGAQVASAPAIVAMAKAGEVLAEGKQARGADATSGYQFGDLSRGVVNPIISEGKQARGVDATSGYQFGDLSRGLLARLGA